MKNSNNSSRQKINGNKNPEEIRKGGSKEISSKAFQHEFGSVQFSLPP
jgi:hypothetical protein